MFRRTKPSGISHLYSDLVIDNEVNELEISSESTSSRTVTIVKVKGSNEILGVYNGNLMLHGVSQKEVL